MKPWTKPRTKAIKIDRRKITTVKVVEGKVPVVVPSLPTPTGLQEDPVDSGEAAAAWGALATQAEETFVRGALHLIRGKTIG